MPSSDSDSINTISPLPPSLKNEGIRDNPKGWAVVLSAFCVNFFCIGIIFQWGNYQQLYLKIYGNQTDTFRISFVGAIQPSTLLGAAVLLPPLIQRLGYRKTMLIGTFLAPLGLVLASMATQLWHIYLSQGLLYGLGCGFVYAPAMALPSLWFKKNRSFATGLAASGTGIGALVISPLTEKLFETVGYQNALRAQGAIGFGLLMVATACAFSTEAQPLSLHIKEKQSYGGLFKNMEFLLIVAYSSVCYFGYFPTLFFIPQYTTFLGHSPADGAVMISVMSGLNSLSRVFMGLLADRCGNLNVMFSCALLAGLFSSVLWQLSSHYGTYIAFCIGNGATAGAFVSLLPVVIADIVGLENIQLGVGICFLATYFGNLAGPPISGELLETLGWTGTIQFAGIVTLFSATILLCLRMKRSKGKIFIKL